MKKTVIKITLFTVCCLLLAAAIHTVYFYSRTRKEIYHWEVEQVTFASDEEYVNWTENPKLMIDGWCYYKPFSYAGWTKYRLGLPESLRSEWHQMIVEDRIYPRITLVEGVTKFSTGPSFGIRNNWLEKRYKYGWYEHDLCVFLSPYTCYGHEPLVTDGKPAQVVQTPEDHTATEYSGKTYYVTQYKDTENVPHLFIRWVERGYLARLEVRPLASETHELCADDIAPYLDTFEIEFVDLPPRRKPMTPLGWTVLIGCFWAAGVVGFVLSDRRKKRAARLKEPDQD